MLDIIRMLRQLKLDIRKAKLNRIELYIMMYECMTEEEKMALDLNKLGKAIDDSLTNITDDELEVMMRKIQKENYERNKWKNLSPEKRKLLLVVIFAAITGTIIGFTLGVLL